MSVARIKRHIRSRIEFVDRGEYERVFGTRAVVIAYASAGVSSGFSEVRRKALCEWTGEVLKEEGKEDWGKVFRFCSVAYGDIYETPIFDGDIWYRPDKERPVKLFGV
jgi:hypothetical protein